MFVAVINCQRFVYWTVCFEWLLFTPVYSLSQQTKDGSRGLLQLPSQLFPWHKCAFIILLFHDIIFLYVRRIFKEPKVSMRIKAFIEQAAHFSAQFHSKDLILHKYLWTKGLTLIFTLYNLRTSTKFNLSSIPPLKKADGPVATASRCLNKCDGGKKETCHEKVSAGKPAVCRGR